jgi:hypothetical protein
MIENTKNFQWYHKWVNDKRINLTKSNWKLKMEDLMKTVSDQNQLKSYIYPSAQDLDSIRFISDITYDCLKGIWNRIVSVPFVYPNGDIR